MRFVLTSTVFLKFQVEDRKHDNIFYLEDWATNQFGTTSWLGKQSHFLDQNEHRKTDTGLPSSKGHLRSWKTNKEYHHWSLDQILLWLRIKIIDIKTVNRWVGTFKMTKRRNQNKVPEASRYPNFFSWPYHPYLFFVVRVNHLRVNHNPMG